MGHHGRRHWRPDMMHLRGNSIPHAGNALAGPAEGHRDKSRDDAEALFETSKTLEDVVLPEEAKVDGQGRFLEGSNLLRLQARQLQEFPRDPTVVVATFIHVLLENGSTAGKFTVPILPAIVSNSDLGRDTIPTQSDSQTIVHTAPPIPPAPSHPNSPKIPRNGPIVSRAEPDTSGSTVDPPASVTLSPDTDSRASSPLPPSTSNTQPDSIPSSDTVTPTQQTTSPESSVSETSTPASDLVTSPTFIVKPVSPSSTPESSTSSFSTSTFSSIASSSSSVASSSSPESTPLISSQNLYPIESAPSSKSGLRSSNRLIALPTSDYNSTISASLPTSSSFSLTSSSFLSTTTNTTSYSPSYITSTAEGSTGAPGHSYSGGYWTPTAASVPGSEPTSAGDITGSDAAQVRTTKVVGGVVGGVAGIVLLIMVALILLRPRKRKGNFTRRLTPESQGTAAILGPGSAGVMAERSTIGSPGAAGGVLESAGGVFGKWRNSQQPTKILERPPLPPPGERGFKKVSGRKITSVLESGGDGYDGPFGTMGEKLYFELGTATKGTEPPPSPPPIILPSPSPPLSSFKPHTSSISPSGTGTGTISQPFLAPPLGRPPSQESDSSAQIVFRPSPARTPQTSTPDVTSAAGLETSGALALHSSLPRGPLPRLPSYPSYRRVSGTDGIGRSMASSDGSRASRFTEAV
ncbi:hypothetical protein PAAG_07196 [Paracoccidioides lutzii Pb01]|uniref:Uncharacterized protein n=1 Tax=Paracoccidioides lutzii (strain ATCC MYA-826 / Pb01) TaxID=502779 RepID=C1H8V5_PARBA|nr:hypothetical protein PAAG_07196 [Paracoccidioides lutzii Pb01]EEH36778.2 hypothetical protein PAAG_07196 [Paracoccidioides lutzii Pb01]